jgi:hypothetical protein
MIGIFLLLSIAFVVGSVYGYLLPYIEAERELNAEKTQKAIATAVIVQMIEGKDDWDDDRPTVVATPKMKRQVL